jgi:hypothetical protein
MSTEEHYTIQDEEIEMEDTSSGQDKIITHPFNPNDVEIVTPPFSIGFLIDKIEHNEINMYTDFQRKENLWDQQEQSRLIESILLGLPLPAFYFDAANEQWDIIDGLQRCCTIENFCVKKTLKLKGLEFLAKKNETTYLEGLGFDDLDRALQRSIITHPITVNCIKKAPRNIRFILFKRLNTGGLKLNAQEIRNAVYQGAATDVVNRLAKLSEFTQATEKKIPTNRMQDRDFVSRFIAFYLIDYSEYQPGLDDFINRSMELLEKKDEQSILSIENDFRKALKLAKKIFGNDAFRKRTKINSPRCPINKAYFEVITVSFAKLSEEDEKLLLENKDKFKNKLIELMKNNKYSNALSRATGTKASVNTRFSEFKNKLMEIIDTK